MIRLSAKEWVVERTEGKKHEVFTCLLKWNGTGKYWYLFGESGAIILGATVEAAALLREIADTIEREGVDERT